MSMISEQIKQLKEEAKYLEKDQEKRLASILRQAADTIEALSAKLSVANMERSDRYYDVRKELVEQYNKAFELINKMPLEGNEVWHGYVGGVMQTLGYLIDFVDKSDRYYGGGWIACEDRLSDKEVLCCDQCGEMILGYIAEDEGSETGFSAENDSEYMYNCVKWMEKPKP